MTRFHTPDMIRLRNFAQALMSDECVINRVGEDGGLHAIYTGVCKLQSAGGNAAESSVAGSQTSLGAKIPQWTLYLHVPWSVKNLREGDIAVITTAGDSDLEQRMLRLVNLQSEKTHATAHRWNVVEIPREVSDEY